MTNFWSISEMPGTRRMTSPASLSCVRLICWPAMPLCTTMLCCCIVTAAVSVLFWRVAVTTAVPSSSVADSIYKEQGVSAGGVDGECLLAVAQIGDRARIIALAGQFEAEQAFIVGQRGASDLWQREGCADERVARFPVNDFSFQAESGCTQRQCNEQEGQQSP